MRKITVDWGDIFYSEEMFNEFSIKTPDDAMFIEEVIQEHFFGSDNSKYKRYSDLYGKLNGLKRYAVLAAHSGSSDRWTYYDDNRECLVQDWINSKDGEYIVLLISACNPESHTPKSKKSLLFIPDRSVGDDDFERSGACFNIIHPEIGEIDSQNIDYELSKLERKLRLKK